MASPVTCPAGTDFQTDAKHCGSCANACGPDDECIAGTCVIACRAQLRQPIIPDPWGWSWDGLDRQQSNFADAETTCTQFRGRLPTASELYRVTAPQSAFVGQSNLTSTLWSLAPDGAGSHLSVRLNDAVVSADPDDTKNFFRCVCPPALPTSYVGDNCYGAAKPNACATLSGEGQRINIDTQDRPPIPKGAAAWECNFYRGHLATPVQLLEASQQNTGSAGGALQSADEVSKDEGSIVGWSDASISYGPSADKYAFRCVGENIEPTAPPVAAGRWAVPSGRSTEAADLPAATLIDAIDECFHRGGHLPTLAELNELIVQGAPAGSGSMLWTSDETDRDHVAVAHWTGIEPAHRYGGEMDAASKKDTHAYRCVYYPMDPAYAGPPADACKGGCSLITSPRSSGAKTWFDSGDRQGAVDAGTGATVIEAMNACRKLGGHLPSERDLTEAIRAGLPNGTNVYLQTSDSMLNPNCTTTPANVGRCSYSGAPCSPVGVACEVFAVGGFCTWDGTTTTTCAPGVNLGLVKWTGVGTSAFDNVSDNGSVGWGAVSDNNAYRCMWTNELR